MFCNNINKKDTEGIGCTLKYGGCEYSKGFCDMDYCPILVTVKTSKGIILR